jgi:tetratricopeptide (TPR) repeat protein
MMCVCERAQRRILLIAAAAVGLAAVGPGVHARGKARIDLGVQVLVRQLRDRGESPAEVHLALAALYARDGSPKTAKYLAAAQKLGMSPVRLALVKAMALRRQGRYDAVFSTLLNVLVTHPEQPYALVEMWKSLYEATLRGSSLSMDRDTVRERLAGYGMRFPAKLALSAKAASQSRKLTALGYSQMLAGRTRYAVELFQAAIDHLPSNARAHRGLGLAREKEHDFMRATGAFLVYLHLVPDTQDAEDIDRKLMRYWKEHTP